MKVTKDVFPSIEEKKNKLMSFFKKEEPREKPYDGTVKYMITKYEYDSLRNLVSYIGYSKGYTNFANESLKKHTELSNLIMPTSEEAPQPFLTFTFKKEQKESLIKAAASVNLTLENYVRAVVWTNFKNLSEKKKAKDHITTENLRRHQGEHVRINLNNELLDKYEKRYGKVTTNEEVADNIINLLNEVL